MGCYIWYSEEGPGRAAAPSSPLFAVPNVTAHPSTACVPITELLYDGPLAVALRFNVAIKRVNLLCVHSERTSVEIMASHMHVTCAANYNADVMFSKFNESIPMLPIRTIFDTKNDI